MLVMEEFVCKSLEDFFNLPLVSLRYHYIATYGYVVGKEIFFDIIFYHYFHEHKALNKYRSRSLLSSSAL